MTVGLQIRSLTKQYGAFTAVDEIDLDVEPGTFISLLGPSGCGKTTTLRMLAGFINPDGGEILVDGEVVSSRGWSQPPDKRKMGMVFQSYAVWPHMTVLTNIAYGLKVRRLSRAEIGRRVEEVVHLVGLGGQEHKYPSQLSGGQQQRVAVARAIVTEPRVLLLDEPLSNLDAKLRESMRVELRRLQKRIGITTVFVTHSQEEALLMSDYVAIMNNGQIMEAQPPEQLYDSPKTRFAADFIGLSNFLEGTVDETAAAGPAVTTPIGTVHTEQVPESRQVNLLVRPENITLSPFREQAPSTDATNTFRGLVREAHFSGNIIDYFVECTTKEGSVGLRVQSFSPRQFVENDEVLVSFSKKAAKIVA